MKKHRLITTIAQLFCGAISLGVLSLQAAPAQQNRGTDILHFSATENMVRSVTDALPDASGKVALRHNAQGKVTVQSLDITVQHLAPNTLYAVLATMVDGTSGEVAEFTTDDRGGAVVRFRKVAHHGNGKINKLGRGHTALPEGLSNLPAVRELSVAVSVENPQPGASPYTDVLVADLSAPDKFQYLVKRDMSSEDIGATLQIQANQKRAQLRLSARGLTPNTSYWLAVDTYTQPDVFDVSEEISNTKGRLEVRTNIGPVTDILDIHELQLRAAATPPEVGDVVVLSTVLPTVPVGP